MEYVLVFGSSLIAPVGQASMQRVQVPQESFDDLAG